MSVKDKIIKRKAKVAVIGLGYVGLPLAVEFARAGFRTTGIDIDKERVRKINAGKSYLLDVAREELSPLVKKERLKATDDYKVLKDIDALCICVPTPLRKTKEPDVSHIMDSAKEVARYLRKGQLIILESTTYPGTTREIILPMLQKKGLKVGRDFYLAFSPERIDPGNPQYKTKNIPKVVGGITALCTEMARLLYQQVIEKVIAVSSSDTAEMVKLSENTFRTVNIALANELALISNRLGIDVWEVISAASTKPFGFMPFYPGPGLGGHCLPIDPFYLSWKARLNDFPAKFIDLAGEINHFMPCHIVERISSALNERGRSIKGSRILILGVTYKRDVDDTRESPAIEIMQMLMDKGASLSYNDPHVPELMVGNSTFHSIALTNRALSQTDCVAIITDHSRYDYEQIVKMSNLVIDTRNATKEVHQGRKKIVKL
ncbi:nucleotide sugar dehydrogenase [candidate division NPL-UPA2 bacterium]|nr:nucleotide sugar dehydrogenase [candidate division NPL-UPA2 bacterium]